MRRATRGIGILVLAALIGTAAVAWHPAIAPVTPPTNFPPQTVIRGAQLAALGDCAVCHIAPDGSAFAGGRPLPTPFGTVYATNITPDPATGIGSWSEAAFRRAMRDGIDRAGNNLYPVLPYPHFTRASDEDIAALYAFFITRAPVHATVPPNRLPFPLNLRPIVAGWNLLFLRPGPWHPDPTHDATWNRGDYLVEAVSHCGACHTPRNQLGAEEAGRTLDGGQAEDWYAPALAASADPSRAWTVDDLAAYLRSGLSARHGVAAGPMTTVTQELAEVPEPDVGAIAVYIASLMPPVRPAPGPREETPPPTDPIFTGACGGCHANDAPMMRADTPSLAVTAAINAPTPRNAIQVILHGIPWRDGHAGPYMPPFDAVLSDREIADLLRYLRARYSDGPPWTDIEAQIRHARPQGAQP